VDFVKYGRGTPNTLNDRRLPKQESTEIEILSLHGVFSKAHSFKDPKYQNLGDVKYTYFNIKGLSVGFDVSYDLDGNLSYVHQQSEGEKYHRREDLAGIRTSENPNGDLAYSKSEGKFHLALRNTQGNQEYTVEIPDTIDVDEITAETGAERLWEDPNAPPEADDQWRFANFPQIMGIKIEPVLSDIEK